MTTDLTGKWHNVHGYRTCAIFRTANPVLYLAELNKAQPLTLEVSNGQFIRPDYREITDLGSIPRPWTLLISRDRCSRSWIMHDSGYQKHGLYVGYKLEGPYVFTPMTREEIDCLMRIGCADEGLIKAGVTAVYYAVRAFGGSDWRRKYRERDAWKAKGAHVENCTAWAMAA